MCVHCAYDKYQRHTAKNNKIKFDTEFKNSNWPFKKLLDCKKVVTHSIIKSGIKPYSAEMLSRKGDKRGNLFLPVLEVSSIFRLNSRKVD